MCVMERQSLRCVMYVDSIHTTGQTDYFPINIYRILVKIQFVPHIKQLLNTITKSP